MTLLVKLVGRVGNQRPVVVNQRKKGTVDLKKQRRSRVKSDKVNNATSTDGNDRVIVKNSTIDMVVAEDRKSDQAPRLHGVVKGGMIHATHLADLCPRQVSLIRKTNNEMNNVSRPINSNDRLTWAVGRAFEDHIRTQITKSVGVERTIGKLACKCEKTTITRDFSGNVNIAGHLDEENSENDVCTICETHVDNYHELPIFLSDHHTVLSPDFGFFEENGEAVVMEFKSLKKEPFLKLNKPDVTHVRQAFLYHLAATINGGNMSDDVIIFYASKGHVTGKTDGAPYREFRINIDDKNYRHIYAGNERSLEIGKVIKTMDLNGVVIAEYDSGGGLPDRPCSTIKSNKAKKCPVSALCFSVPIAIQTFSEE